MSSNISTYVTFSAVFALVRKWCTNVSCEHYVIVMITVFSLIQQNVVVGSQSGDAKFGVNISDVRRSSRSRDFQTLFQR
jgi:hypothetical protein